MEEQKANVFFTLDLSGKIDRNNSMYDVILIFLDKIRSYSESKKLFEFYKSIHSRKYDESIAPTYSSEEFNIIYQIFQNFSLPIRVSFITMVEELNKDFDLIAYENSFK